MRAALLVLAAILLARPAAAVEGARWLLAPEGARTAALANAVTSLQASPEQAWSNPAGLAGLDGVEAGFSRLSFPGAWDADHLVLAAPFHWRHHLGLLYHRNAAQDTLRDALGAEGGSFEVSQSALVAAYAYKGLGWRAGASVKSLSEVIQARSAGGLAYDLGLQADFANERLVLGLAVQNLGSVPDLGGPALDAPLQLRGGTGLRFSGEVSTFDLLVDYRFRPATGRNNVSVGAEYSERYLDGRLGLRVGYDLSQAEQGNGAGLALGLGAGFGPVGLDYAWTPRGSLGSQHRLALNLLWDLRARARAQALDDSLGPLPDRPEARPTPTPTRGERGFVESRVGARLDELLNATPEPTPGPSPTPLPAVAESRPPAKGIIGFFVRLFGAEPKKEEEDVKVVDEERGGMLRGVFRFLGIGGPEPAPLPDSPERADEDSFDNAAPTPAPTPTALPMQRLKGDSVALPEPTPTAVPVREKIKEMMKF